MIPIYGQNVIAICQDLDGFTKFNFDLPTIALFWNVTQGKQHKASIAQDFGVTNSSGSRKTKRENIFGHVDHRG